MFGRVDRTHRVKGLAAQEVTQSVGHLEPHAPGLEVARREIELLGPHQVLAPDPPPFVAFDPGGHFDASLDDLEVPGGSRAIAAQDFRFFLGQGTGVVGRVHSAHFDSAILPIEFGDEELSPAVEVDRAFVTFGADSSGTNGTHHPGLATFWGVLDDRVARARGS